MGQQVVDDLQHCQVLQISLRNMVDFHYILYDQFLPNINEAKHLGVVIDSKLNFNKHIDLVCKRANSI